MLNRSELAKQILQLTSKIFPDLCNQNNIAQQTWDKICKDDSFAAKVDASKSLFLVPQWEGNLGDVFNVEDDLQSYSVLAVDGSQIYPDRNFSGARCFLLNLGGCFIRYGWEKDSLRSKVEFFSEPKVFLPQDLLDDDKVSFGVDLVDLKREELELKKLFLQANKLLNLSLCFVDGTLIFWNLENKQQEVKDYFLNSYLSCLNEFYKNRILVAGYISFPHSRELVNLIRLGLCHLAVANCSLCNNQYQDVDCKLVGNLVDANVARFYLEPNQRTTIFYSTSKITQHYPDQLKPCFFYLHTGEEIIRIEVPFWIVQNFDYLDLICKIAIDQCKKGQGYPVVLAEAHEQAVVKGQDRNFFYHLIQKIGIEQKRRFFVSKKSLKKCGMRI